MQAWKLQFIDKQNECDTSLQNAYISFEIPEKSLLTNQQEFFSLSQARNCIWS